MHELLSSSSHKVYTRVCSGVFASDLRVNMSSVSPLLSVRQQLWPSMIVRSGNGAFVISKRVIVPVCVT